MKPNSRVKLDVFYPHPPERVWQALTDPTALRRWLMPTDFRPRLGHRFKFQNRADQKKDSRQKGSPRPIETVCCEVVTLDAPRRLAYTWQSERDPEPTLVTWTLEQVEGGTRLQLEHILPGGTSNSFVFKAEATANWQMALDIGLPKALRRHRSQRRPVGLILLPNGRAAVRCVGRKRVRCE